MHWEVNLVTTISLLAVLNGRDVSGTSQESVYVIECIRDLIPSQVYSECCIRENNCTVSRQQNRAIDCMSRIIMSNYSTMFLDSRENGPGTTDSYSYNRHQWQSELLEPLSDNCRRQPRARLQTCIRNELIKKCRYSMLQDRFTSSPGRWTQRRSESEDSYSGYGSYGSRVVEPRRRGGHFYNGGRRHHDGYFILSRPVDYNTDARFYSSRGGGYNDDSDDEDFGYSDSDSIRI